MREYFYFRDPYTLYSENFERKNKLQRNLFEPAKACSITAALHYSKLATMCYSHDYWFVLPQFFSHRWLFSSFVDIFWTVSQLLASYTVFKLFIVWFLRWTGSYV